MTFFLVLLAQLAAGCIQRPETRSKRRAGLSRLWAAFLTFSFCATSIVAAVVRGPSKPSAALIGATFIWAGTFLAIVARAEGFQTTNGTELFIRFRHGRGRYRKAARLFIIWSILTTVIVLIPLRYLGVLAHDRLSSAIADVIVLGEFTPPFERRSIAEGQCLRDRESAQVNSVVACSIPHRAEVVAADDEFGHCPDVEEFATGGLEMTIKELVSNGARYCVLQAVGLRHTWRGRMHAPGLAPTT